MLADRVVLVQRKRVHGSLSSYRTGNTILVQVMPSVLLNASQINMASECGGGSLANELVSVTVQQTRPWARAVGNLDRTATKPFVVLGKT